MEKLSADIIHDIAQRSLTICERIQTPTQIAQLDLEHWKRKVERSDSGFFARRLSWDSLSPQELARRSGVEVTPTSIDTSWYDTLRQLILASTSNSLQGKLQDRSQHEQGTFDGLGSVIGFACSRLTSRLEELGLHLHVTTEAMHGLRRHLRNILLQLSSPVLRKEEQIIRTVANPFWRFQRNVMEKRLSAEIGASAQSRLESLLGEHPVWAKLMSIAVERWWENSVRMIRRFASDQVTIARAFNGGQPVGRLTEVVAGLSDPHRGHQSVCRLQCESGRSLMYKPRDTRLEQAFSELLTWINQRNSPIRLRAPMVASGDGYGWSELIPVRPPDDLSTLAERCGALLFLLYVLDGTDAHHENVLICGNDPVLVDGETLFSPRASTDFGIFNQQLTRSLYWESALKCGFLPEWISSADGSPYDLSLFSHHAALQAEPTGSDAMAPLGESYLGMMIRGFESMYKFVEGKKEEFVCDGGPLEKFQRLPVRFIFRHTAKYGTLLARCSHPEFLCDGARRSVEIETLTRTFKNCEQRPRLWNVVKDELSQLEIADVPYFVTSTSERSLPTSEGVVENAFERSGCEHVRSNFQKLDGEDLRFQKQVIQGAFDAFNAIGAHSPDGTPSKPSDIDGHQAMPADELVAQAAAIGELLTENALRDPSGQLTWLGITPLPRSDRYLLQPLNFDLYSGSSGVALFLAGLSRATGDTKYADYSDGSMQWLRKCFQHKLAARELFRQMRPGMADGVGGVIYAVTNVAKLLNSEIDFKLAIEMARVATPAHLQLDSGSGVLSGTAGTILAMLTLYEATGERLALQRAHEFAEILCQSAEVCDSGAHVWHDSIARHPLTGFAHGAAGIAYAMFRMYEVTAEERYRAVGQRALLYEQNLYCERTNSWPDFRTLHHEHPAGQMIAWCHGAPGIGLARAAMLDVEDSPLIRRDIHAAVQAIVGRGLGQADYLCCGNVGRLLILDCLSRQLGDPQLGARVRRQAAQVALSARSTMYQLPSPVRNYLCPGLFQGLSGIGYGFLSVAGSKGLPDLLLFR